MYIFNVYNEASYFCLSRLFTTWVASAINFPTTEKPAAHKQIIRGRNEMFTRLAVRHLCASQPLLHVRGSSVRWKHSVSAVKERLKSASVSEALPLIRQYYPRLRPTEPGSFTSGEQSQNKQKHEHIPPSIISLFYDLCVADASPLAPYFFSQLVTVDQVGVRHFALNCERLVKLLLARDNYEMCIAFIRDIELANKGELALSYDTLEALLIAAKWHKDVDIALQVMQILVGSHSNVYARTWGLFVQLGLETRSYDALKWAHKTALIPGLLVLDDASYLRLAQIAAQNGDLRLCEWSSLRMRRRQRALGSQTTSEDSFQLYVCLIEAAAKNSTNPAAMEDSSTDQWVSFHTVCRYLVRLGPLANKVSVSDLPMMVEALSSHPGRLKILTEIYFELTSEDTADQGAHDAVKTLIFNLLLHVLLKTAPLEAARAFAFEGRDRLIGFNENSILNFIDLALRSGSDQKTLQALAIQCPTPKVMRRIRNIEKYKCT